MDWAWCAGTVAAESAEMIADPFDEDADIRSHLAALGLAALAELRRFLVAPSADRTEILRA